MPRPLPPRRTRLGRSMESREKILAKKTLLQILALVGSLALLVVKILTAIFWLLKIIIRPAFFYFIKLLVVPGYQANKLLFLRLKKFKNYWQEQFGKNFSRNTALYGGLVILSLFTALSNIKAQEERPEEIGRESSLYLLLQSEVDYEIIEEAAADEERRSGQPGGKALAEAGILSQPEAAAGEGEEIFAPIFSAAGDALVRPELAGTDLQAPTRDKITTYVVQGGDTISEIAENFAISANTILWENKLGPRDFIKPGQELVILPVTGVTHAVQKGETLPAIAKKYRAQTEDILEINKLASADELQIGSKLVIPDGIPPAPARAPASRNAGLANLLDIFKPAPPRAGQFNWPTNSRRISQYFRGWRHTGIDVPNKSGQPIYAAEDGIVVKSGWNRGGYGIYIIIDHGQGIQTLYGHNSKNLVAAGQRVGKGQVIGLVGSTGRSTGPHVHFEIRVGGNRVNPLDYF